MLGVNIADVIVRVSELREIDLDTMKKAIEEANCKPEVAPFHILYSTIAKDCEKIESNVAKSYAESVFDVIEEATGIIYSEQFRKAIIDCFALLRQNSEGAIDEYISDVEHVVDKYSDAPVGTIVWFVMEILKRELLGMYAGRIGYLAKLKALVEDVKPMDEQYNAMKETI